MVFSSLIFLSVFIPIILLVYPLLKDAVQTYFLLVVSLFFYWWGEPSHLWVMLEVIVFSYLGALAISKTLRPVLKCFLCGIALILDLSVLIYFKYVSFLASALSKTLLFINGRENAISIPQIVLPIGVSFFVFQSISYVIDVYRDETLIQKNFFKLATYVSMFPQLIAGPIVRYSDISKELEQRDVSLNGYVDGLTRFCFGLGKKVLLANHFGLLADLTFTMSISELTLPLAWLGIVAYTFQIYFDFSGYSDMAIGLGRAMGFNFLENFNYPYISKSLTEFWHRWHMSLSSWFKDYLYIPLGGNRKGSIRTNVNLLVVFALTGFWHGANWTFLFWGLWHGFFLMLEKYIYKIVQPFKTNLLIEYLKWFYCMIIIILGWVLFRANTWDDARRYVGIMFGSEGLQIDMIFLAQINIKNILIFFVAVPVAAGWLQKICVKPYLSSGLAIIILAISYIVLVSSAYNPFIYFRF